MLKYIDDLQTYVILVVAFLIPLAILPIFPNAFVTAKLIILAFGVSLLIILKAIEIILSGKLEFQSSKFDLPILLLIIAYLASAIFRTPNKMEAFFLPGTAIIIISAALFFYLANQLKNTSKNWLMGTTLLSATFVGAFSLLAITGLLAKIPNLPAFIKDTGFTNLGGNLPLAIYLGVLLPLVFGTVINERKVLHKVFWAVCLVIITLSFAANIYNILPGKPASPKSPTLATSWFVAIDALKESPVFGVGAGNYPTAFNRFRPIGYNQTDDWAVRFTNARNFYLTAITETGLVGALALILLILVLYKSISSEMKESSLVGWENDANPKALSLALVFVAMAFSSADISLLVLAMIFLVINSKNRKIDISLSAQSFSEANKTDYASRLPAFIISIPLIVAVGVFYFFSYKVVLAEYNFKNSLDALTQNNGQKTYDFLVKAINQNPSVDRYHLSFAQVNLALANSISQSVSQNPDNKVTDEQRQTITQLIQQSISEAKAAVSLNITRSGNWELLGGIYRTVMPFAQGADQFAIQAYQQAVALDPINPNLRISLGGVYFALGDYENAIDTFKLAVIAKPNFANARYNLAVAYREKGEIEKAISEMTVVLSLVDVNSNDYQIAKKELEDLESKKKTKEEAKSGESLNPPVKAEEPIIEPPIQLPEGAQPPVTPETTPLP